MGKLFNNLSYNNKTVKTLGRPVDDLKALYKKKDADYTTVLDTEAKLNTALSGMKSQGIDKPIVDNARKLFKKTFNKFREQGDLENKVLETKKLANDLANNGLSEIQKVNTQRQAYGQGLKERFDKGNITKTQYLRALKTSDEQYTESGGVQHDEETGVYAGNFQGRDVADYIDTSKEVANVLKGFKADKIPLSFNGKRIIRSPEGFLVQGTQEQVTEADLTKAAKQYLQSNQAIQDQFDDDVFYEMRGLKNINERTVKAALSGNVSEEVKNSLGIKDSNLENLQLDLEAKGLTLEDAYKAIRKDQMTNEALALGVSKESYKKYSEKYIKPLATKDKKSSSAAASFGEILTTTDLRRHTNREEVEQSSKLLSESTANLKVLEGQLSALKDSPNVQEKARLSNEIDRTKFVVNAIEEQTRTIFDNVDITKELADYESLTKYFATTVPKDDMRKLIYKSISKDVSEDDLFGVLTGVETKEQFEANPNSVGSFAEYKKRSVDHFRPRLDHLVNEFKDKLDGKNGKGIDYTTKYHSLAFSNMTPAQRQAHPLASVWDTAKGLEVANQFEFMSSANSNLDIKTHLVDSLDVDEDDIVWDKSSVQPLFDYRADLRNGAYRPAMELTVKVKDGTERGIQQYKDVRVPVFYDNPNYNAKYTEQLSKYRNSLVARNKEKPLSKSELEILDRTNLNIYNSTQYGANVDMKNLYQAANGSDTAIEAWEGVDLNIRTYTENFADGNNFYVTQKVGDKVDFLGVDDKGDVLRLSEAELKDPAIVAKVRSGEYKLSSSSTVNGLKTILADMTLNYQADTTKAKVPQGFVDLKDDPAIRLGEGNSFEQTLINEKVYPNVKNLFTQYPNIVATDISRNDTTKVAGSKADSAHKIGQGAKAIDIRLNDDSEASKQAQKIAALSDAEKRTLGIEKTIAHGEGANYHLHIKFL